jgi:hypothetical protein
VKDHRVRGAVLIALVLSGLLFSCESSDSEKQTLAVYGTVHAYRSPTPPADYPGSDFIAVIGPKDHVKVLQVIPKRNYVAVRIRLSDGHEGWVFSGEGIELMNRAVVDPISAHVSRRSPHFHAASKIESP